MPPRKEPPTPRSAAAAVRVNNPSSRSSNQSASLVPFKPGQTSLRKQAILTEEEYTSALSAVIKRDFFPTLDRMTVENEYLAAVESDDPRRVRRALDKLRGLNGHARSSSAAQKATTFSLTPAKPASERGEWDDTPIASSSRGVFNPTFTPSVASATGNGDQEDLAEPQEPGSGIDPNLDLSLASFQSQYTSEDNASFAQILDRENQERKRKHAYLFAKEEAAEQKRKRIMQKEREEAERGSKLALEANPEHPSVRLIEEAAEEATGQGKDQGYSAQGKTQSRVLDDLITDSEAKEEDEPAEAESRIRWKYTTRNALLYGADANVDTLHAASSTPSTRIDAETCQGPSTNFDALRFPSTFSDSQSGLPGDEAASKAWSPTSSRIDSAIRRGRSGSFASSFSFTDTDTPKVNGWGFVTPHSTPAKLSSAGWKDRRRPNTSAGGRRGNLSPAAKALLERSTKNGLTPASRVGGFASPLNPRISAETSAPRKRLGERGWTPTPQHTQRRLP